VHLATSLKCFTICDNLRRAIATFYEDMSGPFKHRTLLSYFQRRKEFSLTNSTTMIKGYL